MEGERLMCSSRYFHVVEVVADVAVFAEDVDGHRHRLELIAYEGPPPAPGSWVVAHSGYALASVASEEAELAVKELHRFNEGVDDVGRTAVTTSKEAS